MVAPTVSRGLRRFSFLLVAAILLGLTTGAGSVAANGAGPVFSDVRASGGEFRAGEMVFLHARLKSDADIIGNPSITYLFPDGTPGLTALFSRVGGSLRDGEWQATLVLSQTLSSGSYDVGELRAMDAAGNMTVATPSESFVVNADLSVTNPATEPEGSAPPVGDDISAIKLSTVGYIVPEECSRPHPRGPFFAALAFSKASNLAPGERITVFARIINCDTPDGGINGAHIRLQYKGTGGPKDGPYTTWQRNVMGNYNYKAELHLFNPNPCVCKTLTIKELRAWDGLGNDNYFYVGRPYWPGFGEPMFR